MERDERIELLMELRREEGLNRKEFAAKYDIPYPTITDWELGHRRIPEYLLRLLAYHSRMEQKISKEKNEEEDDAFLVIKWTRNDIKNLLEENGMNSSENSVQEFLDKLDIRFFEEQCIKDGMERLASKLN